MGTPENAFEKLACGDAGVRCVSRALMIYAYMGSSRKPYPRVCQELGLELNEPNEKVRQEVEEFCRKQLRIE